MSHTKSGFYLVRLSSSHVAVTDLSLLYCGGFFFSLILKPKIEINEKQMPTDWMNAWCRQEEPFRALLPKHIIGITKTVNVEIKQNKKAKMWICLNSFLISGEMKMGQVWWGVKMVNGQYLYNQKSLVTKKEKQERNTQRWQEETWINTKEKTQNRQIPEEDEEESGRVIHLSISTLTWAFAEPRAGCMTRTTYPPSVWSLIR